MTQASPHPNATLDLKGSTCPGPLLGAKRIVDCLESGQILLLLSDCPGTKDDLFSWVQYTDNQIVKTEAMPDGSTGFYIQKGKATRPEANAVLDIRGVTCPGPIVEAKKLINSMQPGEILRLISNCPGVRGDIQGWSESTGLKLLETIETGAGEYEFYIRK